MSSQYLFRIRTITCFLSLSSCDFHGSAAVLNEKITKASRILRHIEQALVAAGYEVQTVRLATNPFGEWLATESVAEQLERLDGILADNILEFCSLGPALSVEQVKEICPKIVAASNRFSCSASLTASDIGQAKAAARCILQISKLGALDDGEADAPDHVRNGLGNFRFCVAAARPYIPFFPIAKPDSSRNDEDKRFKFAIGLENGALAKRLLADCRSIAQISTVFRTGMTQAMQNLQTICVKTTQELSNVDYLGIDTSLNPSLDEDGSVAAAIETLDEVVCFGGPGTLAAAAAITANLQSLPGIQLSGYCGLMLPLCEDTRLAELASQEGKSLLRISDLLSIGQVCGVGIDTVPIPGDTSEQELVSLLLDVAGIAHRWDKSLSCRVFPVPGKGAGDWTTFASPYMVNSRIISLNPS